MQLKDQYINSQKQVRQLIEETMKQLIKDKVNQIIKDGGANSNTFWRIRKQVTNHNRRDDIETKDENGITITDPNEA